jgi:CheY-like chemotaxis protein
MDLLMPGQEGLETIFALRRQQSHVKIIAVSDGGLFGQTQLLDVAKRFGADQVLRKPFSPASLLQLAADLLAAKP